MRHGEDDELFAIDEIEHSMRKSAEQCSPCAGFRIDHHLRSRLSFDARERGTDREKESLGGLSASVAIPPRSVGDVSRCLAGEDKPRLHNPSCWRISASAAAQDRTESGAWR